jgi:hypothetical protein
MTTPAKILALGCIVCAAFFGIEIGREWFGPEKPKYSSWIRCPSCEAVMSLISQLRPIVFTLAGDNVVSIGNTW